MDQLLGIIGFEDKGDFVSGEQYEYLNIVSTADGCYFARKDNKDVPLTDGEAWKMFSRLGIDGKNIEIRSNTTHIQWRWEGDSIWANLVDLSSLKGEDGKDLDIRVESGYIQTRLTGETWANLVELEILKGPKGDIGEQGKPLIVLSNGNYGNWDESSSDYVDSGVVASATTDIETATVSFTESGTRENLNSGEKVPVLFGKLKKWFSDFGALAWKSRVDYTTEIDNPPSIPTQTSELTNNSGFTTSTSVTNKINAHNIDVNAHNNLFSEFKALSKKDKVDYNTDIDNLPVLSDAQIQTDWDQADISKKDYIRNKPTIPTQTSELANNSDFITSVSVTTHNSSTSAHNDIRTAIGNKADKEDLSLVATTGNYSDLAGKPTVIQIGAGNAVTSFSQNGSKITAAREETFVTDSRIQLVSVLPSTPVFDVLYLIPE